MSRLTQRNEQGTAYYYPTCFEKCDGLGYSMRCDKCELNDEICDKLGKYEDAEEQGLLLKLPCKVGSELYVIRKLCDGKETRVIEKVKLSKAIEIVKHGGVGTESKTIRENANGYSKEDIELNRNAMYNKAIDDFAKEVKEAIDIRLEQVSPISDVGSNMCAFYAIVDEIAEQLKAGE